MEIILPGKNSVPINKVPTLNLTKFQNIWKYGQITILDKYDMPSTLVSSSNSAFETCRKNTFVVSFWEFFTDLSHT